jgi:hypothetical protein
MNPAMREDAMNRPDQPEQLDPDTVCTNPDQFAWCDCACCQRGRALYDADPYLSPQEMRTLLSPKQGA